MSMPWKPERYSDVSPYLIAAGAKQVIDFSEDSLRRVGPASIATQQSAEE